MNKTKTTITLKEKVNGRQNIKATFDVTDLSTDEYFDVIIQMMRLQTYHDMSIWRTLKDKADEMVEFFESIEKNKNEWAEEDDVEN
jgi:beta-galactosidase GanA